ncbi:MAG: hypothetical protein NXI00_10875 [Cytophagales bacterium]|nr:hypothetical protein [Cytophagales bacterium]
MIKTIFSFLKGGGWVAIPCILATIYVVNLTRVNPLQKKLVTAGQEIIDLNHEVDVAITLIDRLGAERDSLINKNYGDSLFYTSEKSQLQSTLLTMKRREASQAEVIKHLETGIRIDLVEKIYKDPLFGKHKLTDSTYTEGWRWGAD